MERAFQAVEHGRGNVFVTGQAGTGKSTFLRHLCRNTKKNYAVLAPTGVAALNVSGQTVHSFFRFPSRFVDRRAVRRDRRRTLDALELLIIDEISMVRAEVFDAIDAYLRLNTANRAEPFGGVKLCIIGDLLQLPPVISAHEAEFFKQYYESPYFFDTESYRQGNFRVIEFTHVYRQQDAHFCNLLGRIRAGEADAELLSALNARVDAATTPKQGDVVLTATNAAADSVNNARLSMLEGTLHRYVGAFSGEFARESYRLPAPEVLSLKSGAQVMFTRNDNKGGNYVNGTLGIVLSLAEDRITVKTQNGTITVKPEKWETFSYEFDADEGKIVQKIKGSFAQYPLIPAWAVTIHKAQGKTLDSAFIDLGRGAFAPGQLYVALSRCRTLGGITLRRRVYPSDIRADARVHAFLEGIHSYVPNTLRPRQAEMF